MLHSVVEKKKKSDPEEETHAGDKIRGKRGRKDQKKTNKKKTSLVHFVLGFYG